jgi:VanZ family protein
LTPNPGALLGLRRQPELPWGDVGIHFTAFMILSVLVHVANWPRPVGGRVLLALMVYGIATDVLQSFVPSRAFEMSDCIENMLGVLAGTGAYWMVRWLLRIPSIEPDLAVELVRAALGETAPADQESVV